MKYHSIYILVLCLVGVFCFPASKLGEGVLYPHQFKELEVMAQYAEASYCESMINGSPADNKVSCRMNGGDCPLVQNANTSILLQDETEVGRGLVKYTTTGLFVAVDHTHKKIVASFRGSRLSQTSRDYQTDLKIIQVKTDLCNGRNQHDGCAVHGGFYKVSTDAYLTVLPVISKAEEAYPAYRIVTTGHSLGGAIAVLVATRLRNLGMTVDVYSYGQPRIGNRDINNYIQDHSLGTNFRVTYTTDLISRLPLRNGPGSEWDHYFPEYWIKQNVYPVTMSDIKVVTGRLHSHRGNDQHMSNIWHNFVSSMSPHSKFFSPGYAFSTCKAQVYHTGLKRDEVSIEADLQVEEATNEEEEVAQEQEYKALVEYLEASE